jgi:hypothetical protein
VLKSAGTADDRLTLAFRLATSRAPGPRELAILRAGLAEHLACYRADRDAALLLVSRGEYPRDPNLDVAELVRGSVQWRAEFG